MNIYEIVDQKDFAEFKKYAETKNNISNYHTTAYCMQSSFDIAVDYMFKNYIFSQYEYINLLKTAILNNKEYINYLKENIQPKSIVQHILPYIIQSDKYSIYRDYFSDFDLDNNLTAMASNYSTFEPYVNEKMKYIETFINSIDKTKLSNKKKLALTDINTIYNRVERLLATYTYLNNKQDPNAMAVIRDNRYLRRSITQGLLTYKPNRILKQQLRVFNCANSKEPTANKKGEWFGVEIECIIPCNQFNDDDNASDNDDVYIERLTEFFNSQRIKNVSIAYDGSIHSHCNGSDDATFGAEIRVLSTRDNTENLKKVCKLLNQLDANVDRSCGLHVHIDHRELTNNTKATNARICRFYNSLNVLRHFVPKHRLENTYCKWGVTPTNYINDHDGRYYAINTTALDKFGTIEIRLHSGSLEYNKIMNYVNLLFGIKNSHRLGYTVPKTLNQLLSWTKQNNNKKFWQSRYNVHQKETQLGMIHSPLTDYWNDGPDSDDEDLDDYDSDEDSDIF